MSTTDAVAAAAPWPAPLADGPVVGTVSVPGSKSATNRALVLAALADGTSRLSRPLVARDTRLMVAGLRSLGVDITDDGDAWVVTGSAGALVVRSGSIDCGLAGTVARFLPPVATLATGDVRFDGDPRMRERPMAPLLAALRQLGARLDDSDGRLPLVVHGTGTPPAGGAVEVDASTSSQLISGLLLAASRFRDGVDVRHAGASAPPSAPHLAMTVDFLRRRGVHVDDTAPHRWVVRPGVIAPLDEVIESDLSSAAAYLAAAMVTGGAVTVAGWPAHSTQPGVVLPELFSQMGGTASLGSGGLTLTGPGALSGLDADLHDVGELTPVVAAACALANTPSRLTGIAHLRMHETDRLAALARELTALGGSVEELPDGLVIRPAPLHGGEFHTYDDHRLAMAAAVVGLAVGGIRIENMATTAKTVPGFADSWSRLVRG